MTEKIPFFIVEDSRDAASSIIYLVYKSLSFKGTECVVLMQLDTISISDVQAENHKIAVERLVEIKHGDIISTSQILGGRTDVY